MLKFDANQQTNKQTDQQTNKPTDRAKTICPQVYTRGHKKLEEINNKVSKVLTKEEFSFIRKIIKETVEQIKEKLFATVLHRIEILEGNVFEQKRDIEKLQNKVLEKNKQIEELRSKNEMLQDEKALPPFIMNSKTIRSSTVDGTTSE
ncbi:hypothetical protein DPMN_109258 [Dreissena polymorpha]|uniref:Uncharacterized protein n=1 Tax=Dreissena polymorpha TaxID=45954 RepID=A0A9D4QMT7_DREPO|nr:hypothetical protein DPMN_109258 [Dreissena polymorpha]